MLNINKMCASDTPRVYKQGKNDRKRFPEKEALLKAMLFRGSFFDHYHIYKSQHTPEPSKSYSTVKNQEYIKALSKKAAEVNKRIASFEDYQKAIIQRSGVLKSTPALTKLITGGEPMTIENKFDVSKASFLKSSSKKKGCIETVLDVDYVRQSGDSGFFIHCLFGKSINTNNITFHIENYGLDMLISATKDVLSIEYPKVNWEGWILVIDTEQYSSFLAMLNEDVVDVAKQAYKKRIYTLDACFEQKNFLHFDGIYGEGTGIVQLPISKRTIDLRTKSIHW